MADFDGEFESLAETIRRTDSSSFDETVRLEGRGDERIEAAEEALDSLPRIAAAPGGGRMAEIELGETIGSGATGEVQRARQTPVGREVAVKRVRPDADERGTDQRELSAGLLREAWVTGYLEHPNIVPIHRVGSDAKGDPLIVMKHIEGVSWREILDEPDLAPEDYDADRPLAWHVDTLVQVARAVEYAHHHEILHRDLKPENVMIGDFGEVYVVDWGIALSLRDSATNDRIPTVDDPATTAASGTPAYMAPELIRGETEKFGASTDVYLLGGMLYELLTGDAPHRGDSIVEILRHIETRELRPRGEDVPGRLADICERALARDPDQRFDSVGDFRRALVDYQDHRESVLLAEDARSAFDALRSRYGSPDDVEYDQHVARQFARCRSGFEQALKLSEDNERARRGLQDLLEWMIEVELQREGYEAARHFIADLPEPRPELAERVEALGEELDTREEEYEQLKELRREYDVDIGKYGRSLLALALGSTFALADLLPTLAPGHTGYPATWEFLFNDFLARTAIVGASVYWLRDLIFKNEVNRDLVTALVVLHAARGVSRFLGWIAGPPTQTVELDVLVMLGGGFAAIAVALDRRVLWLAGAYFVGAVGCAFLPAYFYHV
ncbi:MAG: serine/threonine-protein kinase, partial [Bradymonadaceae bacterium]